MYGVGECHMTQTLVEGEGERGEDYMILHQEEGEGWVVEA